MRNFYIGMLCGALTLIAAALLFLVSGFMLVATKSPALPMEKTLSQWALRAALRGERDRLSPLPADIENILAGARIYSRQCSICHGLPAQEISAIAKGMFPPAPQFFSKQDEVTDDPPSQIHWFIKNGIRLTGMPGFVDSLSESEIWQVSMFLHRTDDLPVAVKDFLGSLKKRN